MKKPSLEEVKEYFKNALIVESSHTGWKGKINIETIRYEALAGLNFISCNCDNICGVMTLWSEKNGYSKILTYKEPKEETFVIDEELKEEELWLPVHNYYGFYEVSNMGNVRSLSRKVKHSKNPEFTKNVFGRILSKSINPQGYNKVRLSMYGDKKTHLVYHLVSEAFLGHVDRSEFFCVDHIDEDKTNDRVSNLQIITKKENTKKSFDYKLKQFNKGDFWFHNTGELVLVFDVTKLHGGKIKCKYINNTEHFAFHGICVMDRKASSEEV